MEVHETPRYFMKHFMKRQVLHGAQRERLSHEKSHATHVKTSWNSTFREIFCERKWFLKVFSWLLPAASWGIMMMVHEIILKQAQSWEMKGSRMMLHVGWCTNHHAVPQTIFQSINFDFVCHGGSCHRGYSRGDWLVCRDACTAMSHLKDRQ